MASRHNITCGVALKAIPKKNVKGNEESVRNEMWVLQGLDCPNTLAVGGELFEHISQHGHFSGRDVVSVLRSVLSRVMYLHDHNIVHWDLKPEIMHFRTKDQSSDIVIAFWHFSAKHLDSTGSRPRLSPEV